MAVKYKNSREQLYYLSKGKTTKSKTRYFFSQKSSGDLVDRVPEGYEIYENVNGQVFLRKICPKVISDLEIKQVKDELKIHLHLKYYQTDIKKNTIVIYQPLQDIDRIVDIFKEEKTNFKTSDNIEKIIRPTFWGVMRFVLVNPKHREFAVERWCYFSDIVNWMPLHETNKLPILLKKFIPHLGQESFFDLY